MIGIDVLAIVVAVVSVIVSIRADRRSRLAENANQKYQDVQQRLAELELIKLTQQANITISFENKYKPVHNIVPKGGVGRLPAVQVLHFLIIKNAGNVDAYDIKLSFEPLATNKKVPHGLAAIPPIPLLAPGQEISLQISLGLDEVLDFYGIWEWKNPDKTIESRKSYLLIPSN